MFRSFTYAACITLLCLAEGAHGQQTTGPGEVARPRKAEATQGVTVVGCVLPETRPNAFRLVVAPPSKDRGRSKLPKGLKAGSSLELVARGETNLQPFANQKTEVTGKLKGARLEVVDARPVGPCDPVSPLGARSTDQLYGVN